jgi:hypothetical protein
MQRDRKWFSASIGGAPLLATAMVLAAGCQSKPKVGPASIHVPSEAEVNAHTLDSSFTQQMRNGAAVGRTIYPHHFVVGDAALTLVGQRHFNALLPRSDIDQVRVSVPRGDASDALYQARLDGLRRRFIEAGYDEERFALVDALPGGDGISSDRVLLLAAKEEQNAGGQANRRAGGTGSSDRSSGSGQNRSMSGGASSGSR